MPFKNSHGDILMVPYEIVKFEGEVRPLHLQDLHFWIPHKFFIYKSATTHLHSKTQVTPL